MLFCCLSALHPRSQSEENPAGVSLLAAAASQGVTFQVGASCFLALGAIVVAAVALRAGEVGAGTRLPVSLGAGAGGGGMGAAAPAGAPAGGAGYGGGGAGGAAGTLLKSR